MKKKFLSFLMAGFLILGSGFQAAAASVTDVKQQQTQTKNKLNEINQSITAIENKRKEVQSELTNLNADLVETILTLELLEADLEAKQIEIDEAQAEYEKYKDLEERQYRMMKYRIQYLYENSMTGYLELFLTADSLSEMINRVDFARNIYQTDEEYRARYEETKELTAEHKEVLEEEQAELEEVQEAQQVYKEQLDSQIASAKSKVENFETELANAQAKAKEYQNTIKKQTELIKQLEEEEKKNEESGSTSSSNGTSSSNSTSTSQNTSNSANNTPAVSGSGTGAAIAQYALKFVGNPYVFGGTSLTNGTDCSGFTMSVHKHFGILIPRSSVAQAAGGKPVSVASVQPGDIIYYGNHVGIYIGGGKIVHASTEKTGIKISNYTYRPPICARRYW